MHGILFLLLDPWHANTLGEMVGVGLFVLATLAAFTAVKSAERFLYSVVAFYLFFCGVTLLYEGVSLGRSIAAIALARDYVWYYHVHHINKIVPIPYPSMGNVAFLLMIAPVGVIMVHLARRINRPLLANIGALFVVATVTVASDIALYAGGPRILAFVTTICWLLCGLRLWFVLRAMYFHLRASMAQRAATARALKDPA